MPQKTNETMSGLNTKELLKLRKSKLENKKRHLQNLVNKRDRLNVEIKGALKSLKRELKSMQKPLRESVEISVESTSQELLQGLASKARKDPEVESLLKDIGHLENLIISYAEPTPIVEGFKKEDFRTFF